MTVRTTTLASWPGFELPGLGDLADGVSATPARERLLDVAYHDAADLRLARHGFSVRHETGAEPGWVVGLPPDRGWRREIRLSGAADTVPPGARALVRGHLRAARLRRVARVQIRRSQVVVRGPDGARWCEADDDEVSVLSDGRVAARFRQVSLTATASMAESATARALDRLHGAGAGSDGTIGAVAAAVGPPASAPPEPSPVELPDAPTVGTVAGWAITGAVLGVLDNHHVIVLDEDPEGVHQSRVGTRRTRSHLHTFASFLDRTWARSLADELVWFAGRLGAVRDADVLAVRLRPQIAALSSEDRGSGELVLARLDAQRVVAVDRLLEAMATPRYATLCERLVDAAMRPRLVGRHDRPATEALPHLVQAPWRRLEKAVARLEPDPSDDDLHRLRVRTKPVRYAADAAAEVLGQPARRSARRFRRLQGVLGDHHDAAVAEWWLRNAAADLSGPQGLVCGLLVAVQQTDARRLRDDWSSVWARASAKKAVGWLR